QRMGARGAPAVPILLDFIHKSRDARAGFFFLSDPEPAIIALGSVGGSDEEALDELIRLTTSIRFRNEPDHSSRRAAVMFLGKIAAQQKSVRAKVTPVLVAAATDDCIFLVEVVEALESCGPSDDIVKTLRRLKLHPRSEVRKAAADALQRISP